MTAKPFIVLMLFPILQTSTARKRIMPTLATSAGCRLKLVLGIPIQRRAPWDAMPRGVSTKGIISAETMYPSR